MRLRSNFLSGSVGTWRLEGPRRVYFQVRTDGAPVGMWFYFIVEDAKPGPIEFVLENLDECLGLSDWVYVRPVYRSAEPGRVWRRAADGEAAADFEKKEFRFICHAEGSPLEVAYAYPYPPTCLQRLVDDLRSLGEVLYSEPEHSAGGRPVPYILLPSFSRRPEGAVWLLARQHAGEVSGSYTLDGFLRAVVRSPLRARFEFHALPMVDVDGVVEGRYGKNSVPIDHGDAWYADGPRPEVRLAMRLIHEAADRGAHPVVLLDFHSPTPERRSYIYVGNPTLLDTGCRSRLERLALLLIEESPKDFPLTLTPEVVRGCWAWYADDAEGLAQTYVAEMYGAPSMIVETAYHAAETGTESNPENCRRLGVSLLKALERFLSEPAFEPGHLFDAVPVPGSEAYGWIFWRLPVGYRYEIGEDRARFLSFDHAARVHLHVAAPWRLSKGETTSVHVSYEGTSPIEIEWYFYDACGVRMMGKRSFPVSGGEGSAQYLSVPELSEGARWARPGFRLEGFFRELAVELKRRL